MKLTGRTILITGGSSGIGLELARQLLARGNVVIATGRDQARLDRARAELPELHTAQTDVADPAAIRALHAEIAGRFPALDTLVNNAGIMRNIGLAEPRSLEDLTREIGINVEGPMRMVQQFLPDLRRSRDALIVNVSSGLAFIPFRIAPVYSASKAAIHAYTICLRAQLAGTGVSVVELAPPATETPLFHGALDTAAAGPKEMKVDVLVRHAIAGIEAGRTEIRPGLAQVLKIASRVAPGLMFRQLAKVG